MNSFSYRPLKIIVGVIVGLGIALNLAGAFVLAQAPLPAASKYKPTEIQQLKLEVAQKDAQLAQVQLQRAQQVFQSALAKLDDVAGQVKRENGWPEGVQFSPDSLTFIAPPEQPAPKTPTPTPPAKKP